MKKFEQVALNPNHKCWDQFIERPDVLYSREDDIRSPFARDYTRVLHSLAYRRLKHKTQVFFNAAGNDHICTRIEHVQHVESVSNTIAKTLGLNEELTRAIALSHDLGHAPFGHQGEHVIKTLTQKYLGKDFWHEQNGVYFVDHIELLEDNQSIFRNLNLTYAVRDGIISHCGELDNNSLRPRQECFDLSKFDQAGKYEAATWEGCVVKLADKIAYLGRDIEDAIRLGYLTKEQMNILREMARINNQNAMNTSVITHNMIIDLCQNSSIEKGLSLSESMSAQLNDVKQFNYQYIYRNKRLQPFEKYSELILTELFYQLLNYYDDCENDIVGYLYSIRFDKKRFVENFAKWLVQYCNRDYSNLTWVTEISKNCKNHKVYGDLSKREDYIQAVIDFLAGMTDVYAIKAFEELLQC